MGVKKYFTIHGHFYQPQRKNPWTGIISEDTPNQIYSTYNQMITDECYGPLGILNINLNKDEFVDIYSVINFDFGPTLLTWIEKNYPRLYITIQNSDMISQKIYGYGNAIAQVYNHAIMPLLPLREKKLYVKWGIESFKRTFKRYPEGIWLSECACDNETLEVLINANIKYTILAPHQIKSVKRIADGKTTETKPGIYLWRSKQDNKKSIVIFVYNNELSHMIFRDIQNTEKFALRIKNTISPNFPTIIATDGENYGHHIKNGDKYLINLIKKIKHDKIELTNLSFLYYNFKPEYEIEINENTSWSCQHGITRWMDECSCGLNPEYKYKRWKKTLKQVTDRLNELSYNFFISSSIKYIENPDDMLNNYITTFEEESAHTTLFFIQKYLRHNQNTNSITEILSLLDMEYKSSLSKTSCGFFFDDISNIETIYNIKNLIFISQILLRNNQFREDIEKLINTIKKEKSNNKSINVEKIIDYITLESKIALNIMLCEFAYLQYLNFHMLPYKTDWKIRINQIDNEKFELQYSNIHTLKQKLINLEIYNEKSNILFKILDIDTNEKDIITINQFSKKVKELIEILKSDKPQDLIKKKFLYAFSNSLVVQDIVKLYLELLKNNTAHTLPFAYEFALSTINLSAKTPFLTYIAKEIVKTPLSPLIWKIKLISEKKYDIKKN